MNDIDYQIYFETGDPKTSVHDTLDQYGPYSGPTNLGKVTWHKGKRYQKVRLEDSTLTLAPAVKLIFFWKDRSTYTVTFDIADSEAGRNSVAGLLETGATVPGAGDYLWALQEAGAVTATGTTTNFTAGMVIVAHTGSGHVNGIAEGTAPTCMPIGTLTTAVNLGGGAGDVVIDLNIPPAPQPA